MPGKVVLSKSKFENLISHLVKIEDEKNMLIEEYFLNPPRSAVNLAGYWTAI